MAARAIWKGVLRLDGERVPVKLYSALEDRSVHFRLLHEADHVPVSQRLIDHDGEPVDAKAARRAYVTSEHDVVMFTDEELDALKPTASRDIELLRFVPESAVDHRWYVRPYYLGPDGKAGEYFALAEALRGSRRLGVARWVMRKKEYRGALRVSEKYLVLVTLRAAEELVDANALRPPAGQEPGKKELAMAQQLLSMLEESFEPAQYEDDYRLRVMELIEAKAKGAKIPRGKPPARKRAPRDLTRALSASLEQERKRA